MIRTLRIPLSHQQEPQPPIADLRVVERPYGGDVVIRCNTQVTLRRVWVEGRGGLLQIQVGNMLVMDSSSWSNAPVVAVAVDVTVSVRHEHQHRPGPGCELTSLAVGIEFETKDEIRASFLEDGQYGGR